MMMAAAAAAAAGVCLAADAPVETPKVLSSNIVGYQKMALVKDALTPAVSTFIPVGGDVANGTLGDTIAANDAWDCSGDMIQLLTPQGLTKAKYTYISEANAAFFRSPDGGGFTDCVAGWYDFNQMNFQGVFTNVSDTPLPAGAGILAKAGNPGVDLIFKGEVLRQTVTNALTKDALTLTGNTAPADLTLGDITANDAWDCSGDMIQLLDSQGLTKAKYTYISEANAAFFRSPEGGGFTDCVAGWYDFNQMNFQGVFTNVSDTALQAGAGILAKAGNPGVELTLPKAEIAN